MLERLGITLQQDGHGNVIVVDKNQDFSFRFVDLSALDEQDDLTMKYLYTNYCPVQRIDVGYMGSAEIMVYMRWVEESIEQQGGMNKEVLETLPDWFRQLQEPTQMVAQTQLTYKSFLVIPEETMPGHLREYFTKGQERTGDALQKYALGLFYPVSDFDQSSWLELLNKQLSGRDIFDSTTPPRLVRSPGMIQSEGNVLHKSIRIIGLGAVQLNEYSEDITIRQESWLRDEILPALENPGEVIRIATTIWPVHEKRLGNIEKSFEGAARSFRNQQNGDSSVPSSYHAAALERALSEIGGTDQLAFFQSILIDVQGGSADSVEGLHDRVCDRLVRKYVLFKEVNNFKEQWENFNAFLPTIRKREVRRYVSPVAQWDAETILKRVSVPLPKKGVFLGYEKAHYTPFILPLGGNYFLTGSTGSGKSMAAKVMAYRMIPLNPSWAFRIMDNTDAYSEESMRLRGWVDMIRLFGGKILIAREIESEDALREKLLEIADNNVQAVLFSSANTKPSYDRIYLEWIRKDIEHRKPGVVIVDEMYKWFTDMPDKYNRGKFYSELMAQFGGNDTMSLTTIQSLGFVREADSVVYDGITTNINAGKFAFWTPNIATLPKDLNMDLVGEKELTEWVKKTVQLFKQEGAGPLRRPGWCVFLDGITGYEVKIEVARDTLHLLARKDLSRIGDLWGE